MGAVLRSGDEISRLGVRLDARRADCRRAGVRRRRARRTRANRALPHLRGAEISSSRPVGFAVSPRNGRGISESTSSPNAVALTPVAGHRRLSRLPGVSRSSLAPSRARPAGRTSRRRGGARVAAVLDPGVGEEVRGRRAPRSRAWRNAAPGEQPRQDERADEAACVAGHERQRPRHRAPQAAGFFERVRAVDGVAGARTVERSSPRPRRSGCGAARGAPAA